MTATHEDSTDALLVSLLAPPAIGSDRAFLDRVERAIDAETALQRAERRFWRSFMTEALTIVALLVGLWLLSRTSLLAPLAGPAQWGLAPPLLLILALWFLGTQRLRQI